MGGGAELPGAIFQLFCNSCALAFGIIVLLRGQIKKLEKEVLSLRQSLGLRDKKLSGASPCLQNVCLLTQFSHDA